MDFYLEKCFIKQQICVILLTLVPAGLIAPVSVTAEETPSTDPRVDLLVKEIEAGLERRGQSEAFQRYIDWTADRLDASAGDRTWDDKTGNCRLDWVDAMLRDQLWALGEAERFTRHLHDEVRDESSGLGAILSTAWRKLDVPGRPANGGGRETPAPESFSEALDMVEEALVEADRAFNESLSPLSEDEREKLHTHLYPVSTGEEAAGHRFADQELGREICDLIERLDRAALHRAAGAVTPLAGPELLEKLALYEPSEEPEETVEVKGVEGLVHEIVATPAGDIIIGARHDNVYHLEKIPDLAAIVDLGGDNTYFEGTAGPHRPVLVLIDLDGSDTYVGEKPGIQGGAVMGVSLLVNRRGDNTYEAKDVAQGACLVGAGILIDYGGNNRYLGRRRCQGSAVGGIGILIDRGGDDSYRSAQLSQGVGGPLGFGLLADLSGDDHFYAGGYYPTVYGSPGYDAFSQGVGVGPRGVANGGIGVLLAGGGDNVYECDYFSHGGGYWFAAGFARDFSGNDRRIGATRTTYEEGEREVRRFLRWGIAWQAHYGIGVVIDDDGDDFYSADHAGPAFSWDIGLAALMDFGGSDHYENPRASGAEAALGVLFDYEGDDLYEGGGQGLARENVSYHPMPEAGGNFSFLIDYGENSEFDEEVKPHACNRRGAPGGFLISRPAPPAPDELDIKPAP